MGQKKRSNRVPYFNGMKFLNFIHNTPSKKRRRNHNFDHFQKAESSNSKDRQFFCEICTETTSTRDAFYLSGCSHSYCSDCVAVYIRYKLDLNIIDINCPVPECCGSLQAEFCRSILPREVFERWDKALCEVLSNIKEKFYCPFADCSALLINDGTEAVSKLECPNCNRMICAQCKVRWHDGIECSEFNKLNRDDKAKDVMLTNIAKDMRWRQCPKCRVYVAKSKSCNVMTCRFLS
ncbi:putative E3 ubiquitin-protein ligase RNF217-like protein [Trifolium pratense]|uniref:RBR-type E3 ubiquitin transferase n=2 Tax=Trifolium pratense TaxID=57577 RepID=A0A2K3LRV5_TRIPR|nr:E3 ubiquitin-protein ligase RSL1-like [Trifolium pratense]PNX81247.1 putative E3 ubiquitin-protein ligase RNF217-like protein [Trifolium pratense]CAJ2644736.1 unnamed protein product [Trifolium pratense]